MIVKIKLTSFEKQYFINSSIDAKQSSFILSKATYSNLPSTATSKLVATNPSSTGGAIVITYLGKN